MSNYMSILDKEKMEVSERIKKLVQVEMDKMMLSDRMKVNISVDMFDGSEMEVETRSKSKTMMVKDNMINMMKKKANKEEDAKKKKKELKRFEEMKEAMSDSSEYKKSIWDKQYNSGEDAADSEGFFD